MSRFAAQNALTHPQRVRILYKTILRLHRGLPEELQELGSNYARDEFRRHLKCTPMEAQLFMTEWTKYTLTLSEQLGLRGKAKGSIGSDIEAESLDSLRDEQIIQLYELMTAAQATDSEQSSENVKK